MCSSSTDAADDKGLVNRLEQNIFLTSNHTDSLSLNGQLSSNKKMKTNITSGELNNLPKQSIDYLITDRFSTISI